jgi:AcrR family transcriptional regulator
VPHETLGQANCPSQAASPANGDAQKDKRDQIIERAVMLFNEVGYDRVRVGDITESLGMGKGSFYLYFRNKKDLLLTCFDHIVEQTLLFESLPEIIDGDFFTRVRPRMEIVHALEWWPGVINLLRAAELSADAEIRTRAREAYFIITEPLKRDLEEARRAGQALDTDAELAAYGFIGLAENLWYRFRLDDRYCSEQVVEFMDNAIVRWLASGACPAPRIRPTLDSAAHLVDRRGTEISLAHVRCNGQAYLTGFLGLAEIEIGLSRIAALEIIESGEKCLAQVIASDGSEVQLLVDGSLIVSGVTSLGSVRLAIRDLARLTSNEETSVSPGGE